MPPKPGGRDEQGNRRPRERPQLRGRCGCYVSQPSGGTDWCVRCGDPLGPTDAAAAGCLAALFMIPLAALRALLSR